MDSITFHVLGTPMQKGSIVRMPSGGYLPAGTTASRKAMNQWVSDVRYAASEAMGERQPVRTCIRFMCEFQLPYPQSSIRKYQLGWYPHIKKPDVDKLLRSMLDALTGVVWADDSQVAYAIINKVYAWNDRPGAHVVVDFMNDVALRNIGQSHQFVTNVLDSL
jgi:crossover junction endodeoxyribonuclease RusA